MDIGYFTDIFGRIKARLKSVKGPLFSEIWRLSIITTKLFGYKRPQGLIFSYFIVSKLSIIVNYDGMTIGNLYFS